MENESPTKFSSRGVDDLRDAVLDYLRRINGGTFLYKNLCCHGEMEMMQQNRQK